MKKLLCTLALIGLSNVYFAQKCEEKSDPITNEKIISATHIKGPGEYFKFELIKGQLTLLKEMSYGGAIQITVPAGTEFFFKLENGDILKLKTVKEAQPKMAASAYGLQTIYNFVMAVSKEELSKFASSPLTLIRVPKISEDGFYDNDEKSYLVKKIKKPMMKAASCMMSYM